MNTGWHLRGRSVAIDESVGDRYFRVTLVIRFVNCWLAVRSAGGSMKIRVTRRRAVLAAAVVLPLAGFGAVVLPSAYAAVAAPIRVNANGPAVSDSAGTWSADKAYSSGSWGYDTLYGSGSTAHAIAGTSSPALYQTYNLFSAWTG